MTSGVVFDVGEATFDDDVVARSRTTPVVVDFWAAWCGPCRTLGPILERAVEDRGGDVLLAKVDVDSNQGLAARFGVRGIPAVKGFRDGEVVAEFVGAVGAGQVASFLDTLAPSRADVLAAEGRRLAETDVAGAEEVLREALDVEPGHRDAAVALAEILVARDPDEALALVAPHRPAPGAERVAARAEIASVAGDVDALRAAVAGDPADDDARLRLGRALAAGGHYEEAFDELLEVVRRGGEQRDEAREQILGLFLVLGEDDPRVGEARRRLASAIY